MATTDVFQLDGKGRAHSKAVKHSSAFAKIINEWMDGQTDGRKSSRRPLPSSKPFPLKLDSDKQQQLRAFRHLKSLEIGDTDVVLAHLCQDRCRTFSRLSVLFQEAFAQHRKRHPPGVDRHHFFRRTD